MCHDRYDVKYFLRTGVVNPSLFNFEICKAWYTVSNVFRRSINTAPVTIGLFEKGFADVDADVY